MIRAELIARLPELSWAVGGLLTAAGLIAFVAAFS